MKPIRIAFATFGFALLLVFTASQAQAMFHKKEERKEAALKVCVEGSQKTCDKAAEKKCAKKKGKKKRACIKKLVKPCMITAKETCKEKLG